MGKLNLTHWRTFVFAAIVILAVAIAGYWLLHQTQQVPQPPAQPVAPEMAPVPPPLPPAPPPVRATGDVKPPKLIKQVNPVYPEDARQKQIQGVVILECTTDVNGNVDSVKGYYAQLKGLTRQPGTQSSSGSTSQ